MPFFQALCSPSRQTYSTCSPIKMHWPPAIFLPSKDYLPLRSSLGLRAVIKSFWLLPHFRHFERANLQDQKKNTKKQLLVMPTVRPLKELSGFFSTCYNLGVFSFFFCQCSFHSFDQVRVDSTAQTTIR